MNFNVAVTAQHREVMWNIGATPRFGNNVVLVESVGVSFRFLAQETDETLPLSCHHGHVNGVEMRTVFASSQEDAEFFGPLQFLQQILHVTIREACLLCQGMNRRSRLSLIVGVIPYGQQG